MPRHTKKVLIKVPMRQTLFVAHEAGVFILSATELMVTIRHFDGAGNEVVTLILPLRGMVNERGWYLKKLHRLLEELGG